MNSELLSLEPRLGFHASDIQKILYKSYRKTFYSDTQYFAPDGDGQKGTDISGTFHWQRYSRIQRIHRVSTHRILNGNL